MTQCIKTPYPSLPAARGALARIQRKYRKRGRTVPRGVHPCGECHAWHVTSKKVKKIWR